MPETSRSPSAACSAFTASLSFDAVPLEIVDFVKRDFLDWLGCCIAGSADPASKPIKAVIEALGGKPQAQSVGAANASAPQAAMRNAYFSHILEMDDVERESISHPASINIPPALAMAEHLGASGRDLVTAVIAGFEVMLRIGASVTPGHYKIFHTTATAGVFGAAMAAGKILGLSQKELSWALGNAGTLSSGLWQFNRDGAMSKFLHTGNAAANGSLVALLAREGFSGPHRILEGEQGFFAGFARQEPNLKLFDDFGARWWTGTVSFKPYPCCRHTHSAIDAAAEIRRQAKGRALKSVRLNTYNTAVSIAGKRAVSSGREGKFSLTYCAAATILRGFPSDTTFAESTIRDEDIRALEAKIELVVDQQINACVPRNWPCRIEAITEDGEELVAQIQNPTGDPENTLDWEGIETKFRMLTEGIIADDSQTRLIAACRNLENLVDVSTLIGEANRTFRPKY